MSSITDEEAKRQREHLRKYFLERPVATHPEGWDNMWQQNVTPWDHSQSHPALFSTLESKVGILGSAVETVDGKQIRKKALVPGCGRGYDVLLFASHGYDAYGLDASRTAVEKAREYASAVDDNQKFPLKNEIAGRGGVQFIEGNFFEDEFTSYVREQNSSGTFDVIYDYTFLCALPPELRPKWALRMSQLLAPTGHLICLEYPLEKDPQLGGPPFGLSHELYVQLFRHPGSGVDYDSSGRVRKSADVNSVDGGLERLDTWKPDRLHEWNSSAAMMSIWQHRSPKAT